MLETKPDNDLNQISIDDLYPALVQCFGTIACGLVILKKIALIIENKNTFI